MMWSIRRFLQLIAVTVVLLICYAIFLPYILRTIQYDEAVTFFEYGVSPIRALFVYTTPNNHLLLSLSVWISTSLMGDSLIAIRFPAFMAAILSLAYVYRIGFKLKGHLVGLLALSFLAAMPLFMSYVPNARGYSMTVLLSLVFFDLTFFDKHFLTRGQKYTLLLVTAFLVMTLPTMLLLIGALFIWIIIRNVTHEKRHFLFIYLMPILIGSIVGTLFYSYGFISGGLQDFSSRYGVSSFTELVSGVIQQTDLTSKPLFFVLLVSGSLLVAWNHQRRFVSVVVTILTFAVVMALAQEIITGSVLFPRNYVYLTAFFALVMALGISGVIERLTRHSSILIVLILLILGGAASNAMKLGDETIVDTLQATLEAYTDEKDVIIVGCCLDYPIYYINRGTGYFTMNEMTERYIVIPTEYFRFEELTLSIPETLVCEQDQWDTFEVHICTERTPS